VALSAYIGKYPSGRRAFVVKVQWHRVATCIAILIVYQPRLLVEATSTAFSARVLSVLDGDTIRVRNKTGRELTVRLEGIDCPESGQPFGGKARNFTRVETFDQDVVVRPVTTDVHKRLVARVLKDGKDLSLELVKNGLAWHFTEFSRDPVLAGAEREARVAKRGLWSDPKPIPPWVWRRQPHAPPGIGSPIDDSAGPFYGNVSNRVFHAANCKNAHCKNCTVVFRTAKEAVAAGYRAAGDCLH
jgi:endonuclease YncB( thermonuclease family)